MKLKKILLSSLVLIFIFSLSVSGVWAAEFLIANESGIVTVASDEEVANLYTVGNSINIDADVEKDLYAAGNLITINGNVEDDLMLVGNMIIIRGDVGGSLRVAGANILIEGKIGEDLIVAGGTVVLAKTGFVGGDLVLAGGVLEVRGEVVGDALIGGGQVTINNKIGGSVKAEIDEQLNLGKQAEIVGNLVYKAPKELQMDAGAQILGEIEYKKLVKGKAYKSGLTGAFFGALSLAFLLKILMFIVTGLVLVYLLKKFTTTTVKEALDNFWPNLGLGFAAFILTPIAIIILLVTVLGISLGGLLGVAHALLVVLAFSLAGIAFGSWLLKVIKKKHDYQVDWQAVVLGVIVLSFVKFIPFLGWLVALVFMLISLGALYRLTWQAFFKK